MSRNGSGTYNLPAGNPVVTGTTITSSWANTTMQNIADGLTQSVASDGQTPMSGALNMATNKITSLGTPTIATDAATKAYVDLTQTASGITGGTITGATLTNDTIDSTPIGSTTRSTVKATTLDLGLSTQSVAIGQGNASIMKNRIINGAMVIDQRNAGASVTQTTSTIYTLDRWNCYGTVASKFTVQQSSTAPVGFVNSALITSSSAYSVGSGEIFQFVQPIEGYNVADLNWGSANAKTVTLSFWVRSSLTGTFGGAIQNSAGNRSYPFSYTISSANTYEQKSVTITGDTTGTWLTTNGVGMYLYFGLGVGSTFSGTAGSWAASDFHSVTGATSVVGTSGATFLLTGVQIEVGSSSTGYEYRLYNQELSACQRYYWQASYQSTNTRFGMGTAADSIVDGFQTPVPVSLRTQPTVAISNIGLYDGTSTYTITSLSTNYSNGTLVSAQITPSSSITAGKAVQLYAINSSAVISASAEL